METKNVKQVQKTLRCGALLQVWWDLRIRDVSAGACRVVRYAASSPTFSATLFSPTFGATPKINSTTPDFVAPNDGF